MRLILCAYAQGRYLKLIGIAVVFVGQGYGFKILKVDNKEHVTSY